MKSSISLVLLVICTVVLAAQQSQAKKGCQAYGHVCYGGHGKRSLNTGLEQEYAHLNPNDGVILTPAVLTNEQTDPNYEEYPRQFLINVMKSWFGHPRRPADRLNELDYPISVENYNHENLNAIN